MSSNPIGYQISILIILCIIAVTNLFQLMNSGFDNILGIILVYVVVFVGFIGLLSIIRNKS